MIILGFLIDYLVLLFLPFTTFFVINDLDKNSIFSVFTIGFLLDFIYRKLLFNEFILLFFYYVLQKLKIKKRFYFFKNIVLFIIYYLIMSLLLCNFSNFYLIDFFISFLLQILYIIFSKLLLK